MESNTELVNEFECQYYGFSPIGFTDNVYNAMVDSWQEAVQQILIKHPILGKVSSNKNFQREALALLFSCGDNKFKRVLNEFTDFALRYVFRIPANVTLPEHKRNQELIAEAIRTGRVFSPEDIEKQCKIREKAILQKRALLQSLENDLKEANDVIDVLTTMDQLLKQKVGDSNACQGSQM